MALISLTSWISPFLSYTFPSPVFHNYDCWKLQGFFFARSDRNYPWRGRRVHVGVLEGKYK